MARKKLTSANSTCYLTVDGLFRPRQNRGLQHRQNALEMGDYNPGRGYGWGVDGYLSGGWRPTPKVIKISLEANSPSVEIFETWLNQMETDREVSTCDMVFWIPSISRKYTGTCGYLTIGKSMPSAKQMLEALTFTITFEKWEGVPA